MTSCTTSPAGVTLSLGMGIAYSEHVLINSMPLRTFTPSSVSHCMHQYIEQNKSKYEAYWIDPTISYSQHLQQLKSLGSWGTQLELQAFCDYLCLPLLVCSPNFQTRAYCWGRFTPSTHTRSPNVTLPLSGLPFTVDHLEIAHSSTGDHYDSVVPYSEHSSPLQAPVITPRLVASIDLIS